MSVNPHDYTKRVVINDRRVAPPNDFAAVMARDLARMAQRMTVPRHLLFGAVPAKYVPVKGDKVRTTIEGYVHKINADGTVELTKRREPFAVAPAIEVAAAACKLLEQAPVEPMVGDVISGRRIKETAWRRGTVLVDDTDLTLVLTATGAWLDTDDGGLVEFRDLGDLETFEIVHAPGKNTRHNQEGNNL